MLGRLDCCVSGSIDEKEPFKDEVVRGKDRKYTDLPWLCLFVALIITDLTLFGVSIDPKAAKPEYIYTGDDYNGTICNQKVGWFNFTEPNYKIRQCVDSCDEITTYTPKLFVGYWCIPDPDVYESEYDNGVFNFWEASGTYKRMVADVYTLMWWILGFCIGSIAISLMYLYMIWINKRGHAYFVMNIICGSIAGALLIAHAGIDHHNHVTDETVTPIELGQGAIILVLVLIVFVWFIKDRETLTTEIEMMAEAMETIGELWGIIGFAFVYALFLVGCAAYWTVAAFYMFSVYHKNDKATMPTDVRPLVPGNSATYTEIELSGWKWGYSCFTFHMLFLFYMAFVFCYFGYLVVSHMIISWYLEEKNNKESCCCIRKNRGICCKIIVNIIKQLEILWESIGTVLRYHMGTVSLAACSIFILDDLRMCLCSDVGKSWKALRKCCKNCCCKPEQHEEKMVELMENHSQQNKLNNKNDGEERRQKREMMYADVKDKIFPLIEKRIKNLAYEHMISAVIDKKMENIAKKYDQHYSTKDGDHAISVNIGHSKMDSYADNVTPGGPESKYDDEDEEENDVESTLEQIIKKNIKKLEYEAYIKKYIEAQIDDEIVKCDEKRIADAQESEYNEVIMNAQKKKEDGNNKKQDNQDGNQQIPTMIRKEGLILTALYGRALCYSSYRSEKLKNINATRLNVGGYSDYNERFGRIGIASFTTAIALSVFFYLDEQNDSISTLIFPSLIIFLTSYTIGYIFTMILEATVSSLLFCVMLDEDLERWNKKFAINQGKIKNNVSELGNGLSAMLTEHLLIMQLKDKAVNDKIEEMNRTIAERGKKNNLSQSEIKDAQKKLKKAKEAALSTERALLESIDGPMKLTEYLINVILVENYFNLKYKEFKSGQEKARAKYVEDVKDEGDVKDENKYTDLVKQKEKKGIKLRGKLTNFLDYFPISDPKQLENVWKDKIIHVVSKLRTMGLKFKLSGAKSKGIERAFYKSFYSYHKDEKGFLKLTDVLRCSFVFEDFDNLYRCFKAIINMDREFEILRIKDRFNSISEPCGYRDLMINVFCKDAPKIEGIICEIQLHHKIFYKAKKVSHQMYKRTRLFNTDDDQNEAYEYAKKYVRPVLGRFKTYPEDKMKNERKKDLNEGSDIMKVIEPTISKLAYEYCQKHVIPDLPEQEMTKYNLTELSEKAAGDIIPPETHEQTLNDIEEEDLSK